MGQIAAFLGDGGQISQINGGPGVISEPLIDEQGLLEEIFGLGEIASSQGHGGQVIELPGGADGVVNTPVDPQGFGKSLLGLSVLALTEQFLPPEAGVCGPAHLTPEGVRPSGAAQDGQQTCRRRFGPTTFPQGEGNNGRTQKITGTSRGSR